MLKMTGGGLGKCCHIPGRYLNAKKKSSSVSNCVFVLEKMLYV